MLMINGDGVCHSGPPDSYMVPQGYMDTLKRALEIIDTRVRGQARCDAIFGALPNGATFTDLFESGDIWVNYDRSNRQGDWGWTMPLKYPNDLVVTQFALRMGYWSVAGTIVHEMAHLNGADANSHAAENTLQFCQLRSPHGPYDPDIRG